MDNDNQESPRVAGSSGVSKLSLLVAFVAGAFAAWIIISMNG